MNNKANDILVCGGREFGNRLDEEVFIYDALSHIFWEYEVPSDAIVIAGASRGADSVALDWAETNGYVIKKYPAEWNKYGKAAGPIRNKRMLDENNIRLVIAFPGGRGTANMIEQALDRHIVVELPWERKKDISVTNAPSNT